MFCVAMSLRSSTIPGVTAMTCATPSEGLVNVTRVTAAGGGNELCAKRTRSFIANLRNSLGGAARNRGMSQFAARQSPRPSRQDARLFCFLGKIVLTAVVRDEGIARKFIV